MTDLENVKRNECLDRYGFCLCPGPGGLAVAAFASTDPRDGSDYYFQRAASGLEIRLWEEGKLGALARCVAENCPVVLRPRKQREAEKPSRWARCINWLRNAVRVQRG